MLQAYSEMPDHACRIIAFILRSWCMKFMFAGYTRFSDNILNFLVCSVYILQLNKHVRVVLDTD